VPIKNRQQLLLVLTIGVVALFAGDRLVLDPLTTLWKERQQQIAKLRQEVARGKLQQGRERITRSRWEGMARHTLTNNTSAAEQQVFNAITSWAQETGVTVNAITPQWKHDTDDYSTYECRVDAAGNLSQVTRFLYAAEKEPLAFKLEAVELAARDKEGQQLSLGLQIEGLVLNASAK
jgi:hypothetical protein